MEKPENAKLYFLKTLLWQKSDCYKMLTAETHFITVKGTYPYDLKCNNFNADMFC